MRSGGVVGTGGGKGAIRFSGLCGGVFDRRRGKIFPFVPAVEVNQGLHAAPFHDFALEPGEADGLD